jgi:organic radical activating enzyme
MLHLDKALCDAFALGGFQLAIETNGTVLHPGVWAPTITVSPKAATLFNRHGEFLADDAPFKMRSGTQCKVVWPQGGLTEDDLHELRRRTRFFTYAVQPLDGGDLPIDPAHHATCVDFVRRHPEWRLSLQTHKYLAIR